MPTCCSNPQKYKQLKQQWQATTGSNWVLMFTRVKDPYSPQQRNMQQEKTRAWRYIKMQRYQRRCHLEWAGGKLETNSLVNNLISDPVCTNPTNIHTTSLIDSAAIFTLLENIEPSNTANIQLENKSIMQPKGIQLQTRETIQLLLNKILEPGHESRWASGITNKLLSTSIRVDAGCKLFLYGTGGYSSFNG